MLRRRYQHFNAALGPYGPLIAVSSMAASTANRRAATRKDKARRPGKVGLILSGGNVDTHVYAQVLSA